MSRPHTGSTVAAPPPAEPPPPPEPGPAVSASSVAGGSIDLTPDNFDKEVLQSGKAAFIKFLAPW